MSTTQTPRTDAIWADKEKNILEHARTLERELNKWKHDAENLLHHPDGWWERQVIVLKEEIERLRAALERYKDCVVAGGEFIARDALATMTPTQRAVSDEYWKTKFEIEKSIHTSTA